jgi:hypothetical protein
MDHSPKWPEPTCKSYQDDKIYTQRIRDIKEIKKSLVFEPSEQGSYIWAVAFNKDDNYNSRIVIDANRGMPVTTEVYDTVADKFYLEGCSSFEIGYIPVSYSFTIEDTDFTHTVPLPLSVIKKYMTKTQLKNFASWKNAYQSSEYEIRFVQLVELYY